MRIAVIGTGYVGLVSGACFAEMGNHVTCVDNDPHKLERLRAGDIPIYEPGLAPVVEQATQAELLTFTDDVAAAVAQAEYIFIAVGTPPGEDGSADLSHVLAVARDIGRHLSHPAVVVDKSTVPVGTAERVHETIAGELAARGATVEFDVVSNPEFLKEGAAVDDFRSPDRIIVGADSERARRRMAELYGPLLRNRDRILFMGVRDAEMSKYAANAMLATRISFMNEVAALCERVGANVDLVRKGIGSDARIGSSFLFPGPGYGGSCFPKDVKALVQTARRNDTALTVLEAVESANERQKGRLFEKLSAALDGAIAGRRIAVWGLSFKPNTDDMRESPSLTLIESVLNAGGTVVAHDPAAMAEARRRLGDRVGYASTNYEALQGADALVIVTDWNEYRHPDFRRIREGLRSPVIIDGRNLYAPARMKELGFIYRSMGRGDA